MRIRASLAGAMVCAIVATPAPTATGGPTPDAAPPPASVAVRPGAWSYFADPRALRHAGEDYAGWATMDGKIQVASLNREAMSVDTLAKRLKPDDHSNPALVQMPGGPLAAFWSPHVKAGQPDGMYYRVRVHNRWSHMRKVPTNTRGRYGYTYPNPVRVGERLMLFWRGANFQPTYSATRDGKAWSSARTLITGPQIGTDDPSHRERPYAKYYANNGIVHVAYNEAHPNRRRTSLFYVRMRGSRLVDAENVVVGRRPLRWDEGSRIYDGSEGSAWVMDVAATASASPVIVYARRRPERTVQYRYVTWEDGAWQDRAICTSPLLRDTGSYPAGLTIDHSDPRVVYVSRKVGDHFEVEAWATADGGITWANEPLTANSQGDSIRPTTTLGGKTVLWMTGTYAHYRRFNTRIVVAEAREKAAKRRGRKGLASP